MERPEKEPVALSQRKTGGSPGHSESPRFFCSFPFICSLPEAEGGRGGAIGKAEVKRLLPVPKAEKRNWK